MRPFGPCHMGVFGLHNDMCNMDLTLIDPTNWCHRMLTCVQDKHSIPHKLLSRVIICKFYHSKEFIPLIMHWISIMSQDVFNDVVYPFHLSIGLRMKCGGHSQPCPQKSMQRIPKPTCESSIHAT